MDENMVPEEEYVESCLRIFKDRIESDTYDGKDFYDEFTSYLKACGLTIKSKTHIERERNQKCQHQT